MQSPAIGANPQSTPLQTPKNTAPWTPEFIEAVRARVPSRQCAVCGGAIGAARLTWRPEAAACAWCDGARITTKQGPTAVPA